MQKKSALAIVSSITILQLISGATFAADPTATPSSSTPTPTVSTTVTPTVSATVSPTTTATVTPTATSGTGGEENKDDKKKVLGKTSVLGSTSAGMEIAKWLIGGTVGFLTILIGFKIARSNNVEE